MDLPQLRKKIDKTDNELVEILAKRKKISQRVGLLKAKAGLTTRDPEREQEIKERRRKLAEKYGLSPEFVEEIFSLILKESRRIIKEKKDLK